MAPALRMTSGSVQSTSLRRRPVRTLTPTAREPSSSTPITAGACHDHQVGPGAGRGAGRRPRPENRRPCDCVTWNIDTPSCSGPL